MLIDFSNIDFDQMRESKAIPQYVIDVKDFLVPLLGKAEEVMTDNRKIRSKAYYCTFRFSRGVIFGVGGKGYYKAHRRVEGSEIEIPNPRGANHVRTHRNTIDTIYYYGNNLHLCIPRLVQDIRKFESDYEFDFTTPDTVIEVVLPGTSNEEDDGQVSTQNSPRDAERTFYINLQSDLITVENEMMAHIRQLRRLLVDPNNPPLPISQQTREDVERRRVKIRQINSVIAPYFAASEIRQYATYLDAPVMTLRECANQNYILIIENPETGKRQLCTPNRRIANHELPEIFKAEWDFQERIDREFLTLRDQI